MLGRISLYQSNDGLTGIINRVSDVPGQDFTPEVDKAARSLTLTYVRLGTVITVYRSPNADTSDDYCKITVKRAGHPGYILPTFEKSVEDDYVKVEYQGRNGLDGKVSRVRVG